MTITIMNYVSKPNQLWNFGVHFNCFILLNCLMNENDVHRGRTCIGIPSYFHVYIMFSLYFNWLGMHVET